MDNTPQQDSSQGSIYVSSRGPMEIDRMVVTVAVRSYDKLLRTHGHSILGTPLMEALGRRARLEGSVGTQVDAIGGDRKMLRGRDGRFVGAWSR